MKSIGGYSPSQLLFGINIRRFVEDPPTVRDRLMNQLLDDAEKEGFSVEAVEYALRLSQLDELRESALECLSDTQRRMIDAAKGERKVLRVGDLILIRRHIVDKERGHKLEPKWIGPFYLVGFTKGSRSVTYANVQQPQVIVGRRISIKSVFIALELNVPPNSPLAP
jgi:hypothetical protein